MGCSLDRQIDQVGQRELGPPDVEMSSGELPAKYGGNLEVDQFGGCQLFTAKSRPRLVTIPTVISQRDGKDACINDEHARTGARSRMP